MSGNADARTPETPVPEPGLTPEAVVARARALIPAIRDQQDEAEKLGHHTAELDRQFAAAGFYRLLQPRRFGGYEFGLPTFWRAMLAVSAGDPGTGWGLTLGAHHALVVGAWFSEAGQREIFGPSGDFRCPHRPPPMGTAEPVKGEGEAGGGYVVSGTWDYCSGIAHATHFMGNALVTGTTDRIAVVIPREQVTVLDDWGDGATLGMNSSGSNSVRADAVFVPARRTAPGDWTHGTGQAPGARLHGNPMYCGRIYGVYHAGLVIPVIGAARASLEEYEQIILTRPTYFPPQVPRYTHPDYQRPYGQALALTDAAEAIVLRAGDTYMELARRWDQAGEPFTREDDARLFAMLQQAGQLAARAVEIIVAAAGSSAVKRGTRLQRYHRDVSMYYGHIAAQHLATAGDLARVHFGLPDSLFLGTLGGPMARRLTPPFRADHVGSLLRPPALLAARADRAAGVITAEQLTRAEDDAITDAVRMQEEAGLQSATDGEFRRAEWHTDFIARLGGLRYAAQWTPVPVFGSGTETVYEAHGTEVTGRVHLAEAIFGDHFSFLASAVTTAVPKLTIPSPSMAHFRADLSGSGYADRDEFRADLAAAYAGEVAAVAALGCRYLQLDDTLFAFLNDPDWRQRAAGSGLDPERQHEINVGVINRALAGRPDGLAVTVHMCRGNYRSAWFSSGGYDFVAEAVFSGLQADGFFLEYDDERSGTFEPLRFVPAGRVVVLGLVTTKTPALESRDDLKRRVEQAARFVDGDRLCLSPQCGFASTVDGNALTLDQQRAKLDLVVQTAAEIWGALRRPPLPRSRPGQPVSP